MKLLSILLLLLPSWVFAQTQTEQSFMYSSGRIYVVIAVLLIILLGVILYLIRIERKLNRLEKESS
ncbi:hypothetical protein PIECOFPK_01306 [Mycovorax composti]|jgi:hypothetical protein|uniref:CcmD family protein n=2 Tax=Chitinophagaceae TaxID=563835 RepID=A0ABZ2EJX3_9BACT